MKNPLRLLIVCCSLLWPCGRVAASIDELAFGDSPAVMVYLFSLQEAGAMTDSPDTLKRLTNAVAFCRGKLRDDLVNQLESITTLVKAKKYAQARKLAKELRDEIYGE